MKLKVDVFSHLKPHHQYGSKGDEVTLIKQHGNTLIIEGPDKNRYSVPVEHVTEDEVPNVTEEKIIHNPAPVKLKKKHKPEPPKQNTLF